MAYFGHASRDEEGRDEEQAVPKERAVRDEINKQCERLGIDAHLSGPPTSGAHVWETDKILLYLLCKFGGNIDAYDEVRAMALISPAEQEKCLASIKKFEEWQAAKAEAS